MIGGPLRTGITAGLAAQSATGCDWCGRERGDRGRCCDECTEVLEEIAQVSGEGYDVDVRRSRQGGLIEVVAVDPADRRW